MSSRPSLSADLAVRFPGLAHLAAAYLGQMCDYVDGTPEDAVRSFRSGEPQLLTSAAEGIDILLRDLPDAAAREQALLGLDAAALPPVEHLDAFLVWAREQIAAASVG